MGTLCEVPLVGDKGLIVSSLLEKEKHLKGAGCYNCIISRLEMRLCDTYALP